MAKTRGCCVASDDGTTSFVCAVQASDGEICLFRTYDSLRALDLDPTIWQACRATSAATTFFDPIEIGRYRQKFADGALGHNNPIHSVIDEANDHWENAAANVQCIVSIGTGEPHSLPVGNNAWELVETLKKIATKSQDTAERFARDHSEFLSEGKYYRFNVVKGLESVGLEEHKKADAIASATNTYMQKDAQADQVKSFCSRINVEQGRAAPTAVANGGTTQPSMSSDQVHGLTGPNVRPGAIAYVGEFAEELSYRPDSEDAAIEAGWIALPAKIFRFDQAHKFRLPEEAPDLDGQSSWYKVLHQVARIEYHVNDGFRSQTMPTPKPYRFTQPFQQDPRLYYVPLSTAPWCSEAPNTFMAHIPVSEIWRLIASFKTDNGTMHSLSDGHIFLMNMTLHIVGMEQDQPVFRIKFRPLSKDFGNYCAPPLGLADAMCGRSHIPIQPGLSGEFLTNQSSNVQLSALPLPFALVTVVIPKDWRVIPYRHAAWLSKELETLRRISHLLWDHEDAIDLSEQEVPIKVLLQELSSYLEGVDLRLTSAPSSATADETGTPIQKQLHRFDSQTLPSCRHHLFKSTKAFFASPERKEEPIEIEDVLRLLKRPQPKVVDLRFGLVEKKVVEEWWAYFGEPRARWIALALMLNAMANLTDVELLSSRYDVLLDSASGLCYLA